MAEAFVPTLIIAWLVVLNGLFVAAEFAIVGAPRPTIARLAEQGHRRAQLVMTILEDSRQQDRFIATAQLGITLASLGLGMYGEHLLATWLAGMFEQLGAGRWIAAHTIGSVTAIAVLTYFHIVIGEMVPKSLALQRAATTVLWIAPLMKLLQVAAYPLVAGLNGIGNGLLRLLGINRDARTTDHYRTPEELTYLVRESQASGLLRSEPARMVAELLEFSDVTAADVMVPRVQVAAISLGAAAPQVHEILRERPHARYPVYDGTIDRIVGMLHVKDLLRGLQVPVNAGTLRPVPFVPETASVDRVIAAMQHLRAQMAVVLDEHGGTAGIVTSDDLFAAVVGRFRETDTGRGDVYTHASGRLVAAGSCRLEALSETVGLPLEHDEVDTAGGLILALLGRAARVGDAVSWAGFRFEVKGVSGHGVSEVWIDRVGSRGADQ